MALSSDKNVRAEIKNVIVGAAPLAKVLSRWVLRFDQQGQWPGLLKSVDDGGRTHGYLVTRQKNPGAIEGIGRVRFTWTYKIFGLHYYETGTDEANTEDKFKAELDAITLAILTTNIPGTRRVSSEPFGFDEDQRPFGDEYCHYGVATLVLEPCG